MTMQVGMVGSDGVLIASDTRWVDNDWSPRRPWDETKIKLNYKCGIAVSCAGGLITAGHLADQIIDAYLGDENWQANDLNARQRISEAVLSLAGPNQKEAQCIVARAGLNPRLQVFQMARMAGDLGLIGGEPLRTFKCVGDDRNAAIFWAERYYPKHQPPPIGRLVPLAAHLVCDASALNSAGVNGLEIVICDGHGVHRLPDEVSRELEVQSAERHSRIRDELFNHENQFLFTKDAR